MSRTLLLSWILSTISILAYSQDCSELFISEYIEGPGNNNAIEIYNPTNAPVDLTGYTINRYSNGANTNPETWDLSGLIGSGQAVTIGNGQLDSIWVSTYWSLPVDPIFHAYLEASCNGDYDANSTFYFNGDDAMTLEYNGNTIDIFGKVGEDPGSAWTDDATAGYTDANGGTWWTKRQTLIRKSSIKKGVTQNPILFNPTLEYDSLPDATYNGMGTHICDCITTSINENQSSSYIMYPNPAVSGSFVAVASNEKIKNIIVMDKLGSVIMRLQESQIPTYKMKAGTYIISIEFLDGRITENKLIIN